MPFFRFALRFPVQYLAHPQFVEHVIIEAPDLDEARKRRHLLPDSPFSSVELEEPVELQDLEDAMPGVMFFEGYVQILKLARDCRNSGKSSKAFSKAAKQLREKLHAEGQDVGYSFLCKERNPLAALTRSFMH